ncbi:MAG: PDZ domain-containing protein, partial [Candidatus Moranbacteria bacterium]|nr:PDZ domain-containing protein [Candidatus Moranbacteria bacterium]
MQNTKEKKQFIVYLCVLIGVASFSLGILFVKFSQGELDERGGREDERAGLISGLNFDLDEDQASEEYKDFDLDDIEILNEAYEELGKRYVNDLPKRQALLDGAVKGMVDALEDPYTVYFTEEETKDFMTDMEGSFEGIGAEVGMRDEVITIIAPLDDMPAQKAGLKAGDKVLKIDDEMTNDMTLDEAVKKIRGPKGTQVVLTVYREDSENGEPLEIEITRDKIDIKSVKWEMKENKIAYIRISGFLRDTLSEFKSVLEEVEDSGAGKIVLDLRNNPGGYLETAVAINGYFLEKGKLIVEEDYGEKNKSKNKKNYSKGPGDLIDYETVILINEGTASA